MALKKDIYKALEDVVGEDNISNDPAIRPAYYGIDFGAVILPKDTEEVQAIMKLINRHKLNFGTGSTGWMGMLPPEFKQG